MWLLSSDMAQQVCVEASAPSKLILFGEHAVVYGKAAVAASLVRFIDFIPIFEYFQSNDHVFF